jgi:hypothetical protein
MKLAVFVVLGLVASFIVGVLLDAMIEKTFPNRPTGDYPSLTTLLVLVPVAFLIGSIITGFLSRPILNSKWGLLGIIPSFYFILLLMFTGFFNGKASLSILGFYFLIALSWYLASLAGVALGCFLRVLITS